MKEILQRLEGSPGIRGALVMNLDGVVVASVPELEAKNHERIAAFVSAILVSMDKDAQSLGFTPVKRITLWATRGRVLVMPMEQFALVVTADGETDLGYALMEVAGLIRGLLRRSRIDVQV